MSGEADDRIAVLHVDDEPDFAALTRRFLEDNHDGFSVSVEHDPATAGERIREEAFDCIVSDHEMPEVTGIELLERVRERDPTLPFILFTGRGSEEIASEAISAGVTEYMQKTADTDQYDVLANRIRNAVDHQRAQRELEATQRRYRRLVEQNITGIYIMQDGAIEYANPTSAEIFGYPVEDLLEMTAFDVVDPADHELLRETIEKREAGEVEDLNYELTGVRADGERFPLEVHSGRITYEGEPAIMGTLIERDPEHQRLQEYRTLVESLGDPMYALDGAGTITIANEAMVEILGYDRESLVGAHVSTVMPQRDVDRGSAIIQELLDDPDRTSATFEMYLETADGERLRCEDHLAVLRDDARGFRGSVGVVRLLENRPADDPPMASNPTPE